MPKLFNLILYHKNCSRSNCTLILLLKYQSKSPKYIHPIALLFEDNWAVYTASINVSVDWAQKSLDEINFEHTRLYLIIYLQPNYIWHAADTLLMQNRSVAALRYQLEKDEIYDKARLFMSL